MWHYSGATTSPSSGSSAQPPRHCALPRSINTAGSDQEILASASPGHSSHCITPFKQRFPLGAVLAHLMSRICIQGAPTCSFCLVLSVVKTQLFACPRCLWKRGLLGFHLPLLRRMLIKYKNVIPLHLNLTTQSSQRCDKIHTLFTVKYNNCSLAPPDADLEVLLFTFFFPSLCGCKRLFSASYFPVGLVTFSLQLTVLQPECCRLYCNHCSLSKDVEFIGCPKFQAAGRQGCVLRGGRL